MREAVAGRAAQLEEHNGSLEDKIQCYTEMAKLDEQIGKAYYWYAREYAAELE